jgi:hypothetical protein
MGRPRTLETTEVCPDCGGPKYRYAKHCKPCSTKGERNPMYGRNHSPDARAKIAASRPSEMPERRGAGHPMWKGDAVDHPVSAGHRRANAAFVKPETCERCGEVPPRDWHHVDGDTLNNVRENLQALCRACHQAVDGRARWLKARGPLNGITLASFLAAEDALSV